ncbi:uncharacterized protein LOC141855219 [Brevipalpus obovatus]|uniref:uncharacterized protein LOC141855219 n=1 Tax=Brevipalpus obovatus TaxID=246614 RepID=UPI003D9DC0B9
MGRGRGHKGGAKQFTNPERLEERKEKEEKERAWRKKRGEVEDSSEDEESSDSSEESSSEEGGDEGGPSKPKKGPEPLIEVNNPNRVVKKEAKKDLKGIEEEEVQLSRREREEIEKQKAKERYAKLTAEGKTEQARADLARLAIIRQQREEAARKKEEERKAKESAKTATFQSTRAASRSVAADVVVGSGKGKKK